jgi:4-hydroxy-4-methyl-2-oxoglutarate aldolase
MGRHEGRRCDPAVRAPIMTTRADTLAHLTRFTTPTISNALECIGVDPSMDFSDATISMLTPGGRPFIGQAVTARIQTRPIVPGDPPAIPVEEWWRHVAGSTAPTIVVVEDLDPEPHGAMWGEVMGHLHRSLGVSGIVTNGAARDIDELAILGFPIIAGRAAVSHAFARFVEVDVPVRVGGLSIAPGDLLHADRHGVLRIPSDIDIDELAATAGLIEELERELFAAADRPGSTIDSFLATWATVQERWPSSGGRASPDRI